MPLATLLPLPPPPPPSSSPSLSKKLFRLTVGDPGILATGEKTPTPARRAAPSSSEPSSPSTKKAREDVAPAPGATTVDADVVLGLVEMPEGGDSSSGDKTATGMSMGSGPGPARTVGGPMESAAWAILESDLGGSWVANEDLCEVEAVGSPRVRAIT